MNTIQIDDLQHFFQSIQPRELVVLKNTSDLNQIVSAMVALVNTNGGNILIGLGKNSKLVGINPLEIDSIKEYISNNVSPAINFEFNVIQIKHHFIFQIDLAKSSLIHSYKDESRAWIRTLIIEHQVHSANEVLEELLKFQSDDSYNKNVSSKFCSTILSILDTENGSSLTNLSGQINEKRNDLIYNLAYLIFSGNVRITFRNSSFCYFSK